jgi:hypothetical protein
LEHPIIVLGHILLDIIIREVIRVPNEAKFREMVQLIALRRCEYHLRLLFLHLNSLDYRRRMVPLRGLQPLFDLCPVEYPPFYFFLLPQTRGVGLLLMSFELFLKWCLLGLDEEDLSWRAASCLDDALHALTIGRDNGPSIVSPGSHTLVGFLRGQLQLGTLNRSGECTVI